MQKKGISLIVLVITIIVMIILAASVVISLTSNGIIDKASQVVQLTDEKQIQQIAELAWAEAYTDGLRDEIQIKEYIEDRLKENKVDTSKYNIIISGNGVILNQGYKINVTSFIDGIYYNEKPVSVISLSKNMKEIKIDNNQIKLLYTEEGNDVELPLEIKRGEYPFDYIDVSLLVGANYTVPGILIDSNNNLVKKIEGVLKDSEYEVFVLTDAEQLNILATGEYFEAETIYIEGWSDKSLLLYRDVMSTNALSLISTNYMIEENGEERLVKFGDDNFESTKDMIDNILKAGKAEVSKAEMIMFGFTIDVTIIEYEGTKITLINGLSKNGRRIMVNNGNVLEFVFDSQTLYNATGTSKPPLEVRNKETKENISWTNFYTKYVEEPGALEWLRLHEYRFEEQIYLTKVGDKINMN